MLRVLGPGGKYLLIGTFAVALSASLDSAHAKQFDVLYTFTGGFDGADPYGDLIADGAGNLYGTTSAGGGSPNCTGGCGTIFKLAPDGTETVLYAFIGGSDGAFPRDALIEDAGGNFYGTTEVGGGSSACASGCGTVFKLTSNGTETVLHAFAGGSDGAYPSAALIEDVAGNLYGTTYAGGDSGKCNSCGAVFKLSPDGTETILHAFTGGSDGMYPQAGLIESRTGKFYGTTALGGANNWGTVFRIAPSGDEKVLLVFDFRSSGGQPEATMIRDKAGNMYGTTAVGGAEGYGTVFKLSADETETVLYPFCSLPNCADGMFADAALVTDNAGNFYSTTAQGGDKNRGTVFKLAPDGTETVLHSFSGDGSYPRAGC